MGEKGVSRRANGSRSVAACGRVSLAAVLTLFGATSGCSRSLSSTGSSEKASDAMTASSGDGRAPSVSDLVAIDRAENRRRAAEIPEAARTSHDLAIRRRVARALARIADDESAPGLFRALADEDGEVVAWGAYGLGFSCRGHERERAAALIARAGSLDGQMSANATNAPGDSLDPNLAIARAVGRCGGEDAEAFLVGWLRDPLRRTAGAEGLGDAAVAGHALSEPAIEALIEAASGAMNKEPLGAAFYPLSRTNDLGEGPASQLIEAARAALGRPGPWRIMAVRSLRRAGLPAIADLGRVVGSASFTAAERSEAARALAGRKDPREDAAAGEALSAALPSLLPASDAISLTALAGDLYGVLATALASFHDPVPKSAEPRLYILAGLQAPGVPDPLARRMAALRCTAASLLSRGAFEAPLLAKCAPAGSEEWERGRLDALLRRPLLADRKLAWKALSHSEHPRIREAALESIGASTDLGDVGANALADALGAGSTKAGIVAAAAEALFAHPERAQVLAAAAKRAALDPRAPIPLTNVPPPTETNAAVVMNLAAALATTWPPADSETRANLLAAASALRIPTAEAAATAACKDANPYIRDAATKALRALGHGDASCTKGDPPELAPELVHETGATEAGAIVFSTDAGELTIRLDPFLAPIASAHMLALARSGVYKNTIVHRVVPGFVAQFGDPGGDGFGGSGAQLRCETSPVPFEALDVGVPLSGRDTGASQLFVTLARTPHLDGAYSRIGHAEGDWAALAEGDMIHDVRVMANDANETR
jgi:cyclophilin family peptidyl-prolyl cis-trans isomerase